jgi:hypothetical protein
MDRGASSPVRAALRTMVTKVRDLHRRATSEGQCDEVGGRVVEYITSTGSFRTT